MLWVSITEEAPKRAFTFTTPIPRSSIRCLSISGAEPISVSSLTFLISTTSSVTRRWPLRISSSAASDLPMPLSPVIRTPSPYTSTSTPWTEMQGASFTFSHRMASAIKDEVDFFVESRGILWARAACMKMGSGFSSRQNTTADTSYSINSL